jgi:magnesium transporter
MLTIDKRSELIEDILRLLQEGHNELPMAAEQLLSADWALVLESTPSPYRRRMWQLVPEDLRSDVLPHMRDENRHELLKVLEQQEIIDSTQQASSKQALSVLTQLSSSNADAVLASIEEQEQTTTINAAMRYASNQVGRYAVRDFFSLSAVSTVVEARKALKSVDSEILHHYVFATDTKGKFVGRIKVASLWQSKTDVSLSDLLSATNEYILDTEATTNLGAIFKRFETSQLPIVDQEQHLIGIFKAQDVIEHLESYYETELAHAGNVNDEDLFAPVLSSAKQRAIWLGINLMTAILAAMVIGMFETTLDTLVALAVLMPIVASMGGIAGSQTLTLTIRGLATNQLSNANINLLRNKEFKVVLINSVIWAAVVGIIAFLWFDNPLLGLILGIAVIVNMVLTVLSGVAIPYIMHKLKIDPALAGSVVLTTISDVVGFFVFLGLATIVFL